MLRFRGCFVVDTWFNSSSVASRLIFPRLKKMPYSAPKRGLRMELIFSAKALGSSSFLDDVAVLLPSDQER